MNMTPIEQVAEKAKALVDALDSAQRLPADDHRPALNDALGAAGELWGTLRHLLGEPPGRVTP